MVLQLVDEGKVALDTPIEQYLPGVVDGNGYNGNTITVRELLQHTSGIAPNSNPQAQANPDGTYSLAALVANGLTIAPVSAPGTQFNYSNTNFLILGMLIEKITGMPVGQAITTRIIVPLGLTSTTFPQAGDHSLPAQYVHGYGGGRSGIFFFWYDVSNSFEPSRFSSAGAIISTQQDLAKFDLALVTGKVVSPATLAQMETAFAFPSAWHESSGDGYGLGFWELKLSCGGVAWGHAGDLPGYSSLTMATADGRYASVITNTEVLTAGTPTRFDVLDSALCGTPAS